jgi:outer membrane protein assembly factor BamD (BamD/ComL family)
MHYLRRKAYDSAIIYFRDVVDGYPQTPRARDAYLRLVEAYRAIRYKEDAQEVCVALHRSYPGDREVREQCGPGPQVSDSAPAPVP